MSAKLQHSLGAAELKKLNLEIQNLENNKWLDILVKLAPLLSVVIAVGGLVWGIIQFQGQQQQFQRQLQEAQKRDRADQMLKIRSQLRDDLDQLNQFPVNKTLTVSRVEFLLGDLDGLLQSKGAVFEITPEFVQSDRRGIAKLLYRLASQDCNFDQQRDVDFSIAVVDSWDDYKGYLKSDPELIWDLLAVNYLDAITALREKAPQYISQLKYNKERAEFEPPKLVKPADESHFRHFEDLVRGFNKHLDLLDAGSEQRKELIKRFQAATCNKDLTQARFGWSVDPKMYPDWFGPCS